MNTVGKVTVEGGNSVVDVSTAASAVADLIDCAWDAATRCGVCAGAGELQGWLRINGEDRAVVLSCETCSGTGERDAADARKAFAVGLAVAVREHPALAAALAFYFSRVPGADALSAAMEDALGKGVADA